MSQTSISHHQWIQHAIAAAQAGNPSVAKSQFQKAAEEAPGEPAIWLWLGWLADSPASAVKCLELARTDSRFEEIAATGIEFARALADFNLNDPGESIEPPDCDAAIQTGTSDEHGALPEDTGTVSNPVDAVEEVSAVVETLCQQDKEDAEEHEADSKELASINKVAASTDTNAVDQPVGDSAEQSVHESAKDASGWSAGDTWMGDSDSETPVSSTDSHQEDDSTTDDLSEPSHEADKSPASAESVAEADELVPDGPTENEVAAEPLTDSAVDIESSLMKSAQGLWQPADETTVAASDKRETTEQGSQQSQELWQTAADPEDLSVNVKESSATLMDDVDESAEDFVFASDDDSGFDFAPGIYRGPITRDSEATSAGKTDNSRQGQMPDTVPPSPVWRKAQSDWFSVDGSADVEPAQPMVAPDTSGSTSHTASSEETTTFATEALNSLSEEYTESTDSAPSDAEDAGDSMIIESTVVASVTSETGDVAPVNENQDKAVSPRITVNEVWQSADAEKAALSTQASPSSASQSTIATRASEVESAEAALAEAFSQVPAAGPVATPPGFPSATQQTPFSGEQNSVAEALGQKTVLVVDDSPTVRKLVSITLEKRGYKVASAFDGVAAIKEIASHNPSLILMDVNMPRLDGYQLCKLVKKHETTSDIPVLMLSGKDGIFDRLRGKLVGCVGHITKPFTPEVLIEAVEQHVRQNGNNGNI